MPQSGTATSRYASHAEASMIMTVWAADAAHHTAIRLERKRSLSVWLWEMKRSRPCADCGQAFHPAAMHWDHTGTEQADQHQQGSQLRLVA